MAIRVEHKIPFAHKAIRSKLVQARSILWALKPVDAKHEPDLASLKAAFMAVEMSYEKAAEAASKLPKPEEVTGAHNRTEKAGKR